MSPKHNRWSFRFDPRPRLSFYHQKNAVKGSGPPQSIVLWSDPKTHRGGRTQVHFHLSFDYVRRSLWMCVKMRWKQSLALWRSSSFHQEWFLTKTQPAWQLRLGFHWAVLASWIPNNRSRVAHSGHQECLREQFCFAEWWCVILTSAFLPF